MYIPSERALKMLSFDIMESHEGVGEQTWGRWSKKYEPEAIRIIHGSQISRGSQGPCSLRLKKKDSRFRTIRNYSYPQLF